MVALALVSAAPAIAQDEPADEMAEARAIIAVMFPPQARDAQMRDLMTAMSKQVRDGFGATLQTGDPGLTALLDAYLARLPDTLMPLTRKHFPQILEATASAYTREFSLAELQELRRFSATPTGTHYLSRATALIADPAVASANTRYFTELQSIQKVETEKLKAEIIGYLEKHPELAKKLSKARED